MITKKPQIMFSIGRLFCYYFGHRLHISRKITNHIKEYSCSRCGQEMTDTANGFLADLTPRLQETNTFLAKIHERRRNRKVILKAS